MASGAHDRHKIIRKLALPYPLALLTLTLVQLFSSQRSGPLALAEVFAPYLFVPLLLLAPFALMRSATVLRLLLLVCLAVFWLRFAPNLFAVQREGDPDALRLEVLNWNVAIDSTLAQITRLRPVLIENQADVVVLEEAQWEWLRDDPAITQLYPYQLNHTTQATSGLVLLSRYPFLEHEVPQLPPGTRGWPRVIMARLDLGGGRSLTVVAAHPESPYSESGNCRPPLCYDTTLRDSLLPLIRSYVDRALQQGEPLLLAGDFNTTAREPAYGELAAGLVDAQAGAGTGFGNTWPLLRYNGGMALLGIDHMFSSKQLTVLGFATDCTPRGSDHCIIRGRFEAPAQ